MENKTNNKTMLFYTDGACSGNPGIGGWAAVQVISTDNGIETDVLAGHKEYTTNNEMELTAVYKALVKAYKEGCKKVTIYSDSAYVVNAIYKKWLINWFANGWQTKDGKPIKNKKIWENIYKLLYVKGVYLTIYKVKGHDKDPLNELADAMAVKARLGNFV